MPSSRYTEFVATNDITDESVRVQQIKKYIIIIIIITHKNKNH